MNYFFQKISQQGKKVVTQVNREGGKLYQQARSKMQNQEELKEKLQDFKDHTIIPGVHKSANYLKNQSESLQSTFNKKYPEYKEKFEKINQDILKSEQYKKFTSSKSSSPFFQKIRDKSDFYFEKLVLKTQSAKTRTLRYLAFLVFLYALGSNIPQAYFMYKQQKMMIETQQQSFQMINNQNRYQK